MANTVVTVIITIRVPILVEIIEIIVRTSEDHREIGNSSIVVHLEIDMLVRHHVEKTEIFVVPRLLRDSMKIVATEIMIDHQDSHIIHHRTFDFMILKVIAQAPKGKIVDMKIIIKITADIFLALDHLLHWLVWL